MQKLVDYGSPASMVIWGPEGECSVGGLSDKERSRNTGD